MRRSWTVVQTASGFRPGVARVTTGMAADGCTSRATGPAEINCRIGPLTARRVPVTASAVQAGARRPAADRGRRGTGGPHKYRSTGSRWETA